MGHLLRVTQARHRVTTLADGQQFGRLGYEAGRLTVGLGIDWMTNTAYFLQLTVPEWQQLVTRVEHVLEEQTPSEGGR